jgi:hypothetical protein
VAAREALCVLQAVLQHGCRSRRKAAHQQAEQGIAGDVGHVAQAVVGLLWVWGAK